MIERRRLLVGAGAILIAAPPGTSAQPSAKLTRIGLLGPGSAAGSASQVEALRSGLRDLGYVEGKSFALEARWGEGNHRQLADLADELVQANLDVLVTQGTAATRAAKRATTEIPIVMTAAVDAVAARLVSSMARPGGNITGTTIFSLETSAHRLETLREATPRITQVGVLVNPESPEAEIVRQSSELAAQSLKLGVQGFDARRPDRLEAIFAVMARRNVDALVVQPDPMFDANAAEIARLAIRQRFASVGDREFVVAGGLVGYELDVADVWRRAAYFVDRILKGTRPADLPVERVRKFAVILNLRTARALKLTIPPAAVSRADEVIR
ncbi:MAG TPA: ABC transporter substrate-binding protein [Candidatus Bathyarchaeia archaeon]|nr:ABC transporter substrate-binding protein [Candidatus Bathyarchaeia archaeon]